MVVWVTSTSLGNVSTSVGNISTSQVGISTSLFNVSSSVTIINNTVINVSTSVINISTSIINISSSQTQISTSLGNVSSSLGNVSSSRREHFADRGEYKPGQRQHLDSGIVVILVGHQFQCEPREQRGAIVNQHKPGQCVSSSLVGLGSSVTGISSSLANVSSSLTAATSTKCRGGDGAGRFDRRGEPHADQPVDCGQFFVCTGELVPDAHGFSHGSVHLHGASRRTNHRAPARV